MAGPQVGPWLLRLFRRRAGADPLSALSTPDHIIALIGADDARMALLRAVRGLGLNDWAIGAGFVRAAVWDRLSRVSAPTPLADVDVLYFDHRRLDRGCEQRHQRRLLRHDPAVPWSVKNQARMHKNNHERPYRSTDNAISRWIETPTCVAVRLEADDTVTLLAPHGVDDLLALRTRPTPAARRKPAVYRRRLKAKNWRRLWPRLVVRMT